MRESTQFIVNKREFLINKIICSLVYKHEFIIHRNNISTFRLTTLYADPQCARNAGLHYAICVEMQAERYVLYSI